ncbi:hypothetical protein AArcSl_0305 [Halalkaliarchaeum desulfuricum]|uniref:DUF7321 domain-containing protein n=1 Tax=Halalkaliarchaeum desulfuricum TaxID=2055893 RepID=A0A343TFT8_9EURY|nr:hypothetical protein [Halalkaliarchaeum desulfuricum]AUX07960.1 hypothetical protein AArcSl_0305 [Halalkaliarchaeum desulfuricum]
MVDDATIATAVGTVVSASLPFYLYGTWIMLRASEVTWGVLVHHLKFVSVGLALTTVPTVGWMIPRLFDQLSGIAAVHAFLGLQAYALLAVGLTGIARIYQAKRDADLYRRPDQEISLSDLHENVGAWRARLRVGVFGYTFFWLCAWVSGIYRYLQLYVFV